MEHAVVRVGMGIALSARNFLGTVVVPARTGVRGEHNLGLPPEEVARLDDLLRPLEWATHKRSTKQGYAMREDTTVRIRQPRGPFH